MPVGFLVESGARVGFHSSRFSAVYLRERWVEFLGWSLYVSARSSAFLQQRAT